MTDDTVPKEEDVSVEGSVEFTELNKIHLIQMNLGTIPRFAA
jgi:hypothetical protein